MAIHYKTDATAARVEPANGQSFTLDELQAFVGGYIEAVYLQERERRVLLVNEDGRAQGLPHNEAASILAGQPVVGDALLCTRGELGDTGKPHAEGR